MTTEMNPYKRFYAIIRRIPRGRVATYGQIARLAGLPGNARQVGYALSAGLGGPVPWHRVVNAQGEVSARAAPRFSDIQRIRLEKEGVVFGKNDRIPLMKFQWKPQK